MPVWAPLLPHGKCRMTNFSCCEMQNRLMKYYRAKELRNILWVGHRTPLLAAFP